MNSVYMLQCADGSFYTGWTTDLQNRVRTHNSGKGAKYTRSRLPVKLVYWETIPSRSEALRREYAIKQMTHIQKQHLIDRFQKNGCLSSLESSGKNMVYCQKQETGGILMPCIQTKVNVSISAKQKETIKSELGKAIGIIPGKSENWLMLTFEDNCSIYFQGNGEIPAAFVEVKIYGKANGSVYQQMTAAITEILHKELHVEPSRIYVKYEETPYWGWNGNNF